MTSETTPRRGKDSGSSAYQAETRSVIILSQTITVLFLCPV
jgi:hypothetical protein